MTSYAIVAFALLASGCIEGEDPNSCAVDSGCSTGRLCSRMQQCEAPENLFDLTAHWTFNGVAPTAGDCGELAAFYVGAGDAASGFAESAECAAGVVELPRVPASMTTVKASAYEQAAGGSLTVVGSAEVERGGASDVTLSFVLP
jgi:hypothetical protein